MAQVGAGRGRREDLQSRPVAVIHREGPGVGIRIADRHRTVQVLAFGDRGIRPRFEVWSIIHRIDGDVGRHDIRREPDAVRAGPEEAVGAVEILRAGIDQIAGQQIGPADFLTGDDWRAAQFKRSPCGEGLDPDRLKRIAVGIGEARVEDRGVQHDGCILIARGRDWRDRRQRIAVDLQ